MEANGEDETRRTEGKETVWEVKRARVGSDGGHGKDLREVDLAGLGRGAWGWRRRKRGRGCERM